MFFGNIQGKGLAMAWLSLCNNKFIVMKAHFTCFLAAIILFAGLTGCKQKTTHKRPNILFAIADDQSFGFTSFGGAHWVETPAFDRIATEGIYFRNCYAGSPGCAPSRGLIVTGRYPWQNEQSGQHAAGWLNKYVPFVDLLTANGYYEGFTGKGVAPFKYGDLPLRATNAAGKEFNDIKYKSGTPGDERFATGISNVNYFANFKKFMEGRKADEPFFFWYGSHEPHRGYEQGSWKRRGKSLKDVDVPGFLPDVPEVRGDLLDYAVEIEWFDLHLQRMLHYLDSTGELGNTIVVVTADNGMSFPRAKANCYEYGEHVPLAIRFPKQFPGGRVVDDPISFTDLAPTFLELAKTSPQGMLPITGHSIVDILESGKQGTVDENRTAVFSGRERHSSSRYRNVGYPQRSLREGRYLLTWNMKPERWPSGAPQRLIPDSTGNALYPMYGLDKNGVYHKGEAFTDIDAAPSKSFIIEHHDDPRYSKFFDMAMALRPEYEMYDVEKDRYCLDNLAMSPEFTGTLKEMKAALLEELKGTNDPRVVGPDKGIFDTYPRYSPMRHFPKPKWAE